jgi:hypothetical protein
MEGSCWFCRCQLMEMAKVRDREVDRLMSLTGSERRVQTRVELTVFELRSRRWSL